jgi:hypothetical protein
MISTSTGLPAVSRVGEVKASRTSAVAPAGSTAAGRLTTVAPSRDAGEVRDRHGRHQLQVGRVDDAQDRIGGGRLHEIAGVVLPAGDDARKRRVDRGARCERVGRGRGGRRLREGGLGLRQLAGRVLDVAAGRDAAIEETPNAIGRGARLVDACPRLRDLRPVLRGSGTERRDVEPDEEVAACDPIAFRPGHLGDASRLRGGHREVGTGPGRHDRSRRDHAHDGLPCRLGHVHRHGAGRLGLLDGRVAASQDRDAGKTRGRVAGATHRCRHGIGAPIACSRSVNADCRSDEACSARNRMSRAPCSDCRSAVRPVCPER